MTKHLVSISKFLSLVLRHQPEVIGVVLDPQGWIGIDELLAACAAHDKDISYDLLTEVVETSDKQRFAISADGERIRANQGHSVDIDLGLIPRQPPEILFHGTVDRFMDSIRQSGLIKGKRRHVHLSIDEATSLKVAQRRGRPVLLRIDAGRMYRDGHVFFRSENGVWLVDTVPPAYLTAPEEM